MSAAVPIPCTTLSSTEGSSICIAGTVPRV